MAAPAGPYQIVFAPSAECQIASIFDYLHDDVGSPLAAKDVMDEFARFLNEVISYFPEAFKVCPHLRPLNKRYRQASCMTWNIVYRIDLLSVRVLAVIHASKDKDSYAYVMNR